MKYVIDTSVDMKTYVQEQDSGKAVRLRNARLAIAALPLTNVASADGCFCADVGRGERLDLGAESVSVNRLARRREHGGAFGPYPPNVLCAIGLSGAPMRFGFGPPSLAQSTHVAAELGDTRFINAIHRNKPHYLNASADDRVLLRVFRFEQGNQTPLAVESRTA